MIKWFPKDKKDRTQKKNLVGKYGGKLNVKKGDNRSSKCENDKKTIGCLMLHVGIVSHYNYI